MKVEQPKKRSKKYSIYFYKNAGIINSVSFYKQLDIFNNTFKMGEVIELDSNINFKIHELSNDFSFISYLREKDNNNPNMRVKDKETNKIIEDPSFLYNAFICVDHNNHNLALLGEKTAISRLQQYIIEKCTLLISEKHVSFIPLSIDIDQVKRKIRMASKLKNMTIPLAFEDLRKSIPYLNEIHNAIDTKRTIKIKLTFVDDGINYAEKVCNIEEKFFNDLSILIDNEEEREEIINIFSNIFVRKVFITLTFNVEENINIIKETMKKELTQLKKELALRR